MNDALFFRQATDGTVTDCSHLESQYAGTVPQMAFLIGAGPSFRTMPHAAIQASLAPKMAVNHAGRGEDGQPPLVRPRFWTTYDPSARFHRSTFLDPNITKFLLAGRRMDLVPGGSEKLCDCPDTYLLNHESRGYGDAFGMQHRKIVDMRDSFIQALDILFRLGFRRIYCLGCEMRVLPSEAQIEFAMEHGLTYDIGTFETIYKVEDKVIRSDRLIDFVEQLVKLGVGKDKSEVAKKLEAVDREKQYSFSEQKPFLAGVATDTHYWERIQYLRLARRNMGLVGLELYSCTPDSRLNDYFPTVFIGNALDRATELYGDPVSETTVGHYQGHHPEPGEGFGFQRDIEPYGWVETKKRRELPHDPTPAPDVKEVKGEKQPSKEEKRAAVLANFDKLRDAAPVIDEVG
jgi:hypothetical protein